MWTFMKIALNLLSYEAEIKISGEKKYNRTQTKLGYKSKHVRKQDVIYF